MKFGILAAISLSSLLLFVCGCSRSAGLHSVDEARQAADAFLIHADADALIRHMEPGTVTEDEKESFYDSAKRWKRAELRRHPVSIEARTLVEFEEARKKFQQDWPVEMPYAPLAWSHQPEIVFVYYFEIKSEKEPFSGMFSVGAYRRDGLWYFAKQK